MEAVNVTEAGLAEFASANPDAVCTPNKPAWDIVREVLGEEIPRRPHKVRELVDLLHRARAAVLADAQK
ncbi:hypothetical protein [Micromonospora aurantiaca (nom. illeg.)]|uniref:hypothetical protein n=1 Tax=Micromonospora aurantiaca (nom. illeg.) TaxID=47850 RepID=UPI0033ED6565